MDSSKKLCDVKCPVCAFARRALTTHNSIVRHTGTLVLSLLGALLLLAGDPVSAMTALVLFVLAPFVTIDPWTTEHDHQWVILKRGFIRRGTVEVNIDKVASVVVRQSILGRILNFGTVIVRGTSGSASPLTYVDAPRALQRALRR